MLAVASQNVRERLFEALELPVDVTTAAVDATPAPTPIALDVNSPQQHHARPHQAVHVAAPLPLVAKQQQANHGEHHQKQQQQQQNQQNQQQHRDNDALVAAVPAIGATHSNDADATPRPSHSTPPTSSLAASLWFALAAGAFSFASPCSVRFLFVVVSIRFHSRLDAVCNAAWLRRALHRASLQRAEGGPARDLHRCASFRRAASLVANSLPFLSAMGVVTVYLLCAVVIVLCSEVCFSHLLLPPVSTARLSSSPKLPCRSCRLLALC